MVFDAILLFLIFCLGLWFYYSLMFVTLFSSYCMEQMANFGATVTTLSILQSAYYVSLILFWFWCALLISNYKGTPSWRRFLWDSSTGLSVFLICILFSHLILWDNPARPDGTLAIGDGIWTTDSGQKQWEKLPLIRVDPAIAGPQILYHSEYRTRQCVWLNENKVTVRQHTPTYKSLENYLDQYGAGQLKPARNNAYWERPGFFEALLLMLRTDEGNAMSQVLEKQEYRPLSLKERERFLEKQKCMKMAYETHMENFVLHHDVEEACDPSFFPDESEDLLWR